MSPLLPPRLLRWVVPVALDLERPARAGQLVAHLLEQASERGHVLAGADQAGAELVAGVVAAPESGDRWKNTLLKPMRSVIQIGPQKNLRT